MTKAREPHLYAYRGNDAMRGRRIPPRWVEALHRWWNRKRYALLSDFCREFYPFDHALSLEMQNVRHRQWCAERTEAHANEIIGRQIKHEKETATLRLAIAAAGTGWNEDRVDAFMASWFPSMPNARAVQVLSNEVHAWRRRHDWALVGADERSSDEARATALSTISETIAAREATDRAGVLLAPKQ